MWWFTALGPEKRGVIETRIEVPHVGGEPTLYRDTGQDTNRKIDRCLHLVIIYTTKDRCAIMADAETRRPRAEFCTMELRMFDDLVAGRVERQVTPVMIRCFLRLAEYLDQH